MSVKFECNVRICYRGTGNSTQCQLLMRARFNKSSCSSANCSFDGVYQPFPLSSSLKFIAISAFYTTFNMLAPYIPLVSDSNGNFDLRSTNRTQIQLTIQNICDQPWSNLSNSDTSFRPCRISIFSCFFIFFLVLCFNSMYHWTLLDYGYSMTDENFRNFQFVTQIDSNQIGWALGYMINQTNYLDAEYRPSRLLTRGEFIGILICFLVLLVLSLILLFLTILIRLRRRKSPG